MEPESSCSDGKRRGRRREWRELKQNANSWSAPSTIRIQGRWPTYKLASEAATIFSHPLARRPPDPTHQCPPTRRLQHPYRRGFVATIASVSTRLPTAANRAGLRHVSYRFISRSSSSESGGTKEHRRQETKRMNSRRLSPEPSFSTTLRAPSGFCHLRRCRAHVARGVVWPSEASKKRREASAARRSVLRPPIQARYVREQTLEGSHS
jgi:hypothetical protein